MKTRLSVDRRRVLRGMLGGAAVGMGLPLLDCFLNSNGTALASGAPLPVRFGTWFWGCGLSDQWMPTKVGRDYEMPAQLQVLAPFKDRMSVFSGFKVVTDGRPALVHFTGQVSVLSGTAPIRTGESAAPTIDTLVADALGSGTRFRSIEVTATNDPSNTYSRRGPSAINAAETSPRALYTRLFGPGFQDPNAAEFKPDPDVMLRRSVLSGMTEQRRALEKQLGAADRARLDEHFTSVRQLEEQLAMQLQKPAPLEACSLPSAPEEAPVGTDVEWVSTNHKIMVGLLAHALACNQTKVFHMTFSDATSSLRRAGNEVTHHTLTHEEPLDSRLGYQPQTNYFVARSMDGLRDLLTVMSSIREGDGTLLDHSLVFATSDCSFAKMHSIESIPMFVAGRAGGRVKTGLHVQGNGDPVTRVGLTLQQALGMPVRSWGTGSMATSNTIGDVIA